MTVRVLFHVNHLWGVGHYARIAAIANAVVRAGGAATILAGNTPLPGRTCPDVDIVTLPALRSPDASYRRLVDAEGRPAGPEHWAARWTLIAATLSATRPQVVVTETFPFGRRKLSAELLQLAGAAKAQRTPIVASLRDIPTPPQDARRLEECARRLEQFYDAVLVHGDVAVTPIQDVWPGPISVPVRPTGYVVDRIEAGPDRRRGVLVSAGGGGDATALLTVALSLQQTGFLNEEPWTFVTGPNADPTCLRCMRQAPGVESLSVAPDLPARIAAARLSISRGGYNTVVEGVASGTRSVIVPFAPPGEPEQAIRARHFAARGLVTHLAEGDLSMESLRSACEAALSSPPPDPALLNTDGAARSAALLAEIAEGR